MRAKAAKGAFKIQLWGPRSGRCDATENRRAGATARPTPTYSSQKEEGRDKWAAGCTIAIREGSAARNFDALYTLLGEFPGQTMLCSDDKHPDELVEGDLHKPVPRRAK